MDEYIFGWIDGLIYIWMKGWIDAWTCVLMDIYIDERGINRPIK